MSLFGFTRFMRYNETLVLGGGGQGDGSCFLFLLHTCHAS
jgi:hypothetical protein